MPVDALGAALADQGAPSAQILQGVVTTTEDGVYGVSIGGVTPVVRWLAGWTPVDGDVVRVLSFAGELLVLGRLMSEPLSSGPTTSALAAPPGPSSSGVTSYACTDSGYWSAALGWSGSESYGSRLMQGDNTGAWFYGSGPAELAGRTITRARIYVVRSGSWGAIGASPAHLYGHTSASRPGGNVTTFGAPHDATLERGAGDWFDIAPAIGAQVVVGGGVAISGTPYLVLEGVRERSNSGLLELTWER